MSQREWREAKELAEAGRWEAAAEKWQALAERSRRVHDRRATREAASLAADALRRDDRPAAAAKMLRLAFEHGQDAVIDAVQLAAVLLDAGQIDAAFDIAATGLARATDPMAITLSLDTLTGLCLARGDLDGARANLERLAGVGLPGGDLSRAFRGAQVDRLDGLAARAETEWTALAAKLAQMPQTAGPEGATWAELGELDLLRAEFAPDPSVFRERAIQRFERSGAAWTKAGRRAGLFRAEAWSARARALSGDTVVAPGVDRAIGFAAERGMPLLEADLRACRAVVLHDADELLHVLDLCAEAPLARGRARVLRAELAPGASGQAADLELALTELRVDGPWSARALRAIARERGDAALLEEAETRGRALLA